MFRPAQEVVPGHTITIAYKDKGTRRTTNIYLGIDGGLAAFGIR